MLGLGLSSTTAETITLKEAVHLTVESYPQLEVSRQRVIAAEAARKRASSSLLPNITLRADYREEGFHANSSEWYRGDAWSATANLKQLLWDGGQSTGNVSRAKGQVELQRFQLSEIRQDLVLLTVQAYRDCQTFEKLYELAENNLAVHEEVLERATRKSDSGAGQKADTDLVAGRLSLASATLELRREEKLKAYNLLNHLTGQENREVSHTETSPAFPTIPKPENYQPFNNPRYRVSEAKVKVAEKELGTREKRFFPRVFVVASTGLESSPELTGPADQEVHNIGLSLEWDIFNGGDKFASISEGRAQLMENRADQTWNTRQLERQYADVYTEFRQTQKRIAESERYVASIRQVRDAYRQQFELGQRFLLNLLDIENELFNAESRLINEKGSLDILQYRLTALRGDLEALLGLPVKSETDR